MSPDRLLETLIERLAPATIFGPAPGEGNMEGWSPSFIALGLGRYSWVVDSICLMGDSSGGHDACPCNDMAGLVSEHEAANSDVPKP